MTQFNYITADVWQLHEDICALGSPPYEQIMQRILAEASVVGCRRERAKTEEGFFRAIVTIECSAGTIALFHSARSGYRAQYYSSISCGEKANAFALNLLAPPCLPTARVP